jgi:hypothetical protein
MRPVMPATRPVRRLDVGHIRRWLEAIAPPGDARRAALDDLERRFAHD